MDGGSSDILGGPTSPNARDTQSGRWSGLSFGVKSAFVTASFLVLYVIGIRAWETFLVWREKAYKLSMRRRHGIPDNDHRPFNVAYAAVVRARKESEDAARKAKLHELVQDQQSAPPNQNIRQRQGSAIQRDQSMKPNRIPGRYESVPSFIPANATNTNNYSYPSFAYPPSAEDRYNPNPVAHITEREVDNNPAGSSLRPSRKYINMTAEWRKRGFDSSGSDIDHTKTTRVDGDQLIGGEEEAEWCERQQVPQRGSKRVLGDDVDDDAASPSTRSRDKRPRKFSLEEKTQYISEDMDIDEYEDEVADLRSTARGTKRDRTEAGSTFGGDDDDSAGEAEAEQDSRTSRRHRKRRTYAKRKSDVSTRGHKRRNPEVGDEPSDMEDDDGMTLKVSRKKRGKRSVSASEQDEESDVSMDHSQTSSRRGSGKTRCIGDEWESNGVKYKIGPNGQRLRQTLVKKARQKFNMPADSQHPDRQANLEVCIETWLTEDEYREAKDQLLLAWQDSNKSSAEPENQGTPSRDSQELSTVAGKDLLWKSTSASTHGTTTPRQITPPPGIPQLKQKDRELYNQSIAANVGLRINPFQTRLPGKRITATVRVSSTFNGATTTPGSPASPSLTDSTNGSPRHKMFSKWEKQDLEAKAMRKMREANRKKEEMALKLKEEKEKAENAKKALEAPKVVPVITVTKPEEAKPPAAAVSKPGGFSFGPLPSTDTAKTDAPGPSVAAPPQQPKPADKPGSFSFAPAAQSLAKPAAFPPSSTPLGGQPSKPADNPFAAKKPDESTKPPASFGFSAPSAPSFNPTSTTAPPSAPGGFSFGPAPSQPAQPSEKKPEAPVPAAGGSLFSRLAPANAAPSQNTSQPPSTAPSFSFAEIPATAAPSQPTSQPPQTTPSFSFTKTPAAEAPKPTSAFGNLSALKSAPQTTSQPAPSTAPKFNFGFDTKPAGAASASVPAPASQPPSSSLGSALGNPESKAAPTGFGFNAPSTAGQTSTATPAAPGGATTTPKFSFGAPQAPSSQSAFPTPSPFSAISATSTGTSTTPAFGGSNPFGAKPATTASSTTPAEASTVAPAPAQSAFGGFGGAGGSSSSTSAFSSASQPSAASPFGSTNPFGGGVANPFGASAVTKMPEAPKTAPSFSFGNTNTSVPTTTAPASANGKPLFSFGTSSSTPVSSTTAPTAGASPGFSFGDAGKAQAAQSAPGTSVFGKPSTGIGAFGFGAMGTTNGMTSAFGKAPSSTGQQQQ